MDTLHSYECLLAGDISKSLLIKLMKPFHCIWLGYGTLDCQLFLWQSSCSSDSTMLFRNSEADNSMKVQYLEKHGTLHEWKAWKSHLWLWEAKKHNKNLPSLVTRSSHTQITIKFQWEILFHRIQRIEVCTWRSPWILIG